MDRASGKGSGVLFKELALEFQSDGRAVADFGGAVEFAEGFF